MAKQKKSTRATPNLQAAEKSVYVWQAHVLFNIFFCLLLAVFVYAAFVFGRCFGAAERLPAVVQYPVVRLLIYGVSLADAGDTVSASLSILDTAGKECVTVERSWNGTSLSIDFVSAEFSGKKLMFPVQIYGKETISSKTNLGRKARTTKLQSYYLEDGECLLFGSNTTALERKNLHKLAVFAFNPVSQIPLGFSKRYTVDLSRCEAGEFYTIVTGTDGTLALVKE